MILVSGANRHDSMMFEKCIDAIPAIAGLPGRAHQRSYMPTKVMTTGVAAPISGAGALLAELRDEELRAARNWAGIVGSLRGHTDGLRALASCESVLKSAWTSTKRC